MLAGIDVKGMYDTWEKAASAWFDAWARSPAFIATMGRMLEAQLGLKRDANRAVDDVLEAWRIPSARDLASLAERIAAIEDRLAAVEANLDVPVPPIAPVAPVEGAGR